MKRYPVRFSDEALADLTGVFDYLLPLAGETTARAFVARLEAACLDLEVFPERGSTRDDIRPGLRVIGYRRQATIAFAVKEGHVLILRVFGRGRDVEGILEGEAH